MRDGAIAGVTIGVVVGTICLVLISWCLFKRYTKFRASIVGKKSTRKKEEELPVSHCVKIPQQVNDAQSTKNQASCCTSPALHSYIDMPSAQSPRKQNSIMRWLQDASCANDEGCFPARNEVTTSCLPGVESSALKVLPRRLRHTRAASDSQLKQRVEACLLLPSGADSARQPLDPWAKIDMQGPLDQAAPGGNAACVQQEPLPSRQGSSDQKQGGDQAPGNGGEMHPRTLSQSPLQSRPQELPQGILCSGAYNRGTSRDDVEQG